LDIAINGVDYSGELEFFFTETLEIFRIIPQCGPREGKTLMKIIGRGIKKESTHLKWGVHSTVLWDNSDIRKEVYKE